MAGVDLDLFDFDYDLTFAVMFLDGNDRVLARYGGRDAGEASARLSKAGLLHAMRRVLEVHRNEWTGPDRRDRRPAPRNTVERIPAMAERVAAGRGPECFHCHMVSGSRRQMEVDRGSFRKDSIWDYPLPENVGITLERDQGTLVASVADGSPADRAGLRAGDVVEEVDGQRTLTEPDVRYALHRFQRQRLEITVRRGDESEEVRLSLPRDWRRTDISWRESMVAIPPNPGFWAVELNAQQRAQLGIPDGSLGLRVQFVQQGGNAERGGLRQGMAIVAVDGRREAVTSRQLQLWVRLNKNPGDRLALTLIEDGRERVLTIPLE